MSKQADGQVIETLVQKSPVLEYLHKNYPILNEAASYLLSFSLLNTITVFSFKLLTDWKNLNDVYFPFVNQFIDYVENGIINVVFINFIDYLFPSLKDLHLNDLSIKNIYSSLIKFIKSSFIYNKIVELLTIGFKNVNSYLKFLIKDKDEITSNSASNELNSEIETFSKISLNLFNQFKSYPFKIQNHIKSIYDEEILKNNNNSIKAFASTSNELANEITSSIKKQVYPPQETESTSTTVNNTNNGTSSSVSVNGTVAPVQSVELVNATA